MGRRSAHGISDDRALVLFDIDDTLFDHRRALRAGLRAVWADDPALRRRPFRAVVARYESLLDRIQPDVLAGIRTHREARQERFRGLLDWVGSPRPAAEIDGISDRYRAVYQQQRFPVPGAPELLRRLRERVGVGAVSNNHAAEQADKLRAIGMTDLLDFVVTSEEVGVVKPDPEIFRHALERGRGIPSRTVMVGDNWSTDVVGAAASGISAVWLNRVRGTRPDQPEDVVEIGSLRPARDVARRILGRVRPDRRVP